MFLETSRVSSLSGRRSMDYFWNSGSSRKQDRRSVVFFVRSRRSRNREKVVFPMVIVRSFICTPRRTKDRCCPIRNRTKTSWELRLVMSNWCSRTRLNCNTRLRLASQIPVGSFCIRKCFVNFVPPKHGLVTKETLFTAHYRGTEVLNSPKIFVPNSSRPFRRQTRGSPPLFQPVRCKRNSKIFISSQFTSIRFSFELFCRILGDP